MNDIYFSLLQEIEVMVCLSGFRLRNENFQNSHCLFSLPGAVIPGNEPMISWQMLNKERCQDIHSIQKVCIVYTTKIRRCQNIYREYTVYNYEEYYNNLNSLVCKKMLKATAIQFLSKIVKNL